MNNFVVLCKYFLNIHPMNHPCNRTCINTVDSVCLDCDHNTSSICTLCGEVKYTSECICEIDDDADAAGSLSNQDIEEWLNAWRESERS